MNNIGPGGTANPNVQNQPQLSQPNPIVTNQPIAAAQVQVPQGQPQQQKSLQQQIPLKDQQLTSAQHQQLMVLAQQLRITFQQIQQLTPFQVHQMQQKLKQQSQQQQRQNTISFEQQFNMVMGTVYNHPRRVYKFTEDSDSILKKYEKFMQSFELHIYESAYKICPPNKSRSGSYRQEFGGDGLTLNKNDETLKDFLEYVARGLIPASLIDILSDSDIQFYEGNLILQVFDHTNTTDVAPPIKKPSASNASLLKPNEAKMSLLKRPRIYRTLLRPTDLTRYYDMLAMSDVHKLSDAIYQNVESELLTLTNRNLDLSVPLNPYEVLDANVEKEFGMDLQLDVKHRELCDKPNTRGSNPHTEMVYKQPTESYEEMMLQYSQPVQRRNFLGFAVDFKNSNAGKALLAKMVNKPQMMKQQQEEQQQQQQQNDTTQQETDNKKPAAKPKAARGRATGKAPVKRRQVKPKEDKPKDEKPKVRKPRKKKAPAATAAGNSAGEAAPSTNNNTNGAKN